MTVTMQDLGIGRHGGAPSVWRHVGELLAQEHEYIDARFDHMDARFDRLESDVGGLKADVAAINQKLDQREESNVKFQQDVIGRFEVLTKYIARDELKAEGKTP